MTIDSLSGQVIPGQRQSDQESAYAYNIRKNDYIYMALTGARKNEKEISGDKAAKDSDDIIVDISNRSTNTARISNTESGTVDNFRSHMSARYPVFLWLRTILMTQELIKHKGIYVDRFI